MSLTYKDAKELKDAGFPQNLDGNRQLNGRPMRHHDHGPARECSDSCIYIPTLSELIEACGDDITQLYRADQSGKRVWVAKCCDKEAHKGGGFSPEEAVKNLWLAVNKHE